MQLHQVIKIAEALGTTPKHLMKGIRVVKISRKEAKQAIESAQWIAKLQKVINEAPKDVWIFVASGNIHVMALRDGKRAAVRGGGYDQSASCGVIHGIEADGGDW